MSSLRKKFLYLLFVLVVGFLSHCNGNLDDFQNNKDNRKLPHKKIETEEQAIEIANEIMSDRYDSNIYQYNVAVSFFEKLCYVEYSRKILPGFHVSGGGIVVILETSTGQFVDISMSK